MLKKRFKNWKLPKIKHGKLTKWNWAVWHPENFKCGKEIDIGVFTAIFAHYGVTIEDEVQIGSHCSLYSFSTIDDKNGPIILRKNSKIGTHSTIMPNVIVGRNSIVAAHSFVNKNIPANEIWGGVPARFLVTLKEYESKRRKEKNKDGKLK